MSDDGFGRFVSDPRFAIRAVDCIGLKSGASIAAWYLAFTASDHKTFRDNFSCSRSGALISSH